MNGKSGIGDSARCWVDAEPVEGGQMSSKAEAFARLAKSRFRSRFKLDDADRAYIARVGMETIRRHADDFVRTKLASAEPEKDGRQTPMRGHPVFKAMHGSAMCCRGCMEKWWKVPRHRPLSPAQRRKAVDFLMEWIARQIQGEVEAASLI